MTTTTIRTAALAVLFMSASAAQAGLLEIQFTGVDIAYDGAEITDAVDPGSDALTSLVILDNGVVTAGTPFASDIALDLSIPGVTGISAGGDQVLSDPGGSLDLSLPAGDFVSLTLDEVTVTFISTAFVQFSFAGSVAGVDGQSLPAGLALNSPVSVSFSTTIDTLTTAGGIVETFTASGTGEIEDLIPEPTAASLIAIAGLLASGVRRVRS